MIALIRGSLRRKLPASCVVEAGGLGYEVHLTQAALQSLPSLGEIVEFHTHCHTREDGQQLFGFTTPEERGLFLLLLTVKGVGPKLALALLSQLGLTDLLAALRKRDLVRLGATQGVGRKLAERLAVELSDKVLKLSGVEGGEGPLPPLESGPLAQAVQALVALGFPAPQAKPAVLKACQQLGPDRNEVEDIIKLALKFL